MPIRARGTRSGRLEKSGLTCRSLVVAASAVLLATGFTPPGAQGTSPRESRPVHSYENAIRESVWVDTRLDGDGDGRTDRVAVDIVRPREPAQQGRKVPVIMDASPYYSCCGRGNESQLKTYDANGNPVQFPLYYDNYFVPRGYAFVAVDLAGTNRSDGCVDVGGRSDVQSAKAVVDWLNGRGRGYTTRTGTERARAGWTNGRTGMIGKSYDGTIANGVAATGVEGLETIVPIAAISSWYDYYFAKGAPLYDSGPEWLSDYVESPEARDPLRGRPAAARRRGPAHRRLDPPVDRARLRPATPTRCGPASSPSTACRTSTCAPSTSASGGTPSPTRASSARCGCRRQGTSTRSTSGAPQWVKTLHRWFDHYLLGYDNGIEREPMADIERAPDQWSTDRVWPPRATDCDNTAPGQRQRTRRRHPRPEARAPRRERDVHRRPAPRTRADWAAQIDRSTPAKAGFITRPLGRDLRLSGSSTVKVTVTPDTSTAHLSAVLVDLGPDTIRDYAAPGEGITTLAERTCWGAGAPGDSPLLQGDPGDARRPSTTPSSAAAGPTSATTPPTPRAVR